jgi:heme-degrading monooxygenase HmoA
MYATIRIYSEAEGLADAVAEHKAEIVGLFREIDGFRSYHIVKTGPVSATSITVYDDQAGAEASTQIARDWIASNLADLSISAPQVLVGEVAMSA